MSYQLHDVETRANMVQMSNPYPKRLSTESSLYQLVIKMYENIKNNPQSEADFRDAIRENLAEVRGIHQDRIFFGKSTTATTNLVLRYLKSKWLEKSDTATQTANPTVYAPSPTYKATLTDLQKSQWDVTEFDYTIPDLYTEPFIDSFLAEIQKNQPHVVMLANPNNPTGAFFEVQDIARICEAVNQYGGYVVVDEAYLRAVDPYGLSSAVQLLKNDTAGNPENIIILESAHKNIPTHLSVPNEEEAHYSSNSHKMALVFGTEGIINDLKNLVEGIKESGEDEAFIKSITPSPEGILILQLAILEQDHWQCVAELLSYQITHVLTQLQQMADKVNGETTDVSPAILLPKESKNGVFVTGVHKSLVQKVLERVMVGSNISATFAEALQQRGVKVQPELKDHPLATVYEFIRIVVQDEEQNTAFLQAMSALLLVEMIDLSSDLGGLD